MKYLIKTGKLYQIDNGRPGAKLACLKPPYYPVKKTILSPDGRIKLYADVKNCQDSARNRDHLYILSDTLNQTILSGRPVYTRKLLLGGIAANQIRFTMDHRPYNLYMKSCQEYCIMDENSWVAARLEHNPKGGGWLVESDPVFTPFILMGIFIFCRYLDKNNEFLTELENYSDEQKKIM